MPKEQTLKTAVSETTQTSVKTDDFRKTDYDTLYQTALLQSLTLGEYDGSITLAELKQHGDIGIGTFDKLNGEMIMLDGHIYRAKADCSIEEPPDTETTPFADVTFFESDFDEKITDVGNIDSLKKILDRCVTALGANIFYMLRIDGSFSKVTVRSEHAQEKPYRPLDKVMETDQEFLTLQQVEGTVVGLFCPAYMRGLNVPGWHFHFIDQDRTRGGHMTEVAIKEAIVAFDTTDGFKMYLPDTISFQEKQLDTDLSNEIQKVESGG